MWDIGKQLFDNSPSGMVIYDVIRDGKSGMDYIIRSVNPACLEIMGWNKQNIIGKPLKKVLPGVEAFGIIDAFHHVWTTGNSINYPENIYQDSALRRWYENVIFKLPAGQIAAIFQDITKKKQIEDELNAERERLKTTLYSIGDGVIALDNKARIQIMNKTAERLTGWKQGEVKGMTLDKIFQVFDENTGQKFENPVKEVLTSGNVVNLPNNIVLLSKDGNKTPINNNAAPIIDRHGEIQGVVLVFQDVTEIRKKENKIRYLSYRDALTGLYNRTFFESEVERLDSRTCTSPYPMAFIMGDVDSLKLINDWFGHEFGDKALNIAAHAIKTSCRSSDLVARWGGDEFVILLPNANHVLAQKICERIRKKSSRLKVGSTKLSISLGYAIRTNRNVPWQTTLKKAEDHMYRRKLIDAKSYRSSILSSIRNALYEKSYETEAHGNRLAELSKKIGSRMGLLPWELDELEVLAMLHNIGKIAIDERILKKPGPLTASEKTELKRHPEIGYRIAQAVPELLNIAEYILSHHERWDGKGYPRELAGKEIPLLSRILAVANAYDAMVHGRPYRKARSVARAIKELRENAGTQFDPEVVKTFMSCLKKT